MSPLLDLETKLTILSNNPCACRVCATAARFARHALMDVSLSGAVLMQMKQGTPAFKAAEAKFQADEIARLQGVYDSIGQARCMMIPPPALDTSVPPPPPQYTITPIPDLPAPDEWRERIEHYRKHQMKPRMAHRRGRGEMKKNPRMPGTYVIKF